MRVFLEVIQQQNQEEIDLGIPPEIIRIDVTGKSKKEIEKLSKELELLVSNPVPYLHSCFHDESPPKPCTSIKLHASNSNDTIKDSFKIS